MKSLLVLFLFGLTSAQFLSKGSQDAIPTGGCSLPVKDDFSGFYPLLFDVDGNFFPYQESSSEDDTWDVTLPNTQSMFVSCAPNYLRNFNNQKTFKVTCQGDKLINDQGGEVQWKKAACELRPVEEIIVTAGVEHCEAPSHTGVEFGYVNPVTHKTMILGKACYNPDKGHTEFVQMRFKPKTKAFSESALEVEPENYFQRKQHPSGRYKIDLMKAWGDHMRTRADSSIHVSSKRFVLPQSMHLNTLKKLGWNYAFSQEEHETWTELQGEVEAMVQQKGLVVDYYAGSHGVMKWNGNEELFLGKDKRFAVPEYLWMFVREGVQGVAFVVFNKMDMTAEEEKKFHDVCSSKCDQVQWLSSEFKSKHGKYVLCCDVNDARANVEEMPLVTGITRTFLY